MSHILLSLFLISWIAGAIAITQTYFRGEQTKTIQVRNNISEFFASIAQMLTGSLATQPEKVYVRISDRYSSRNRRF